MHDNSHHFRLVRECLFKTRMDLTQISEIVQEWFLKTLGMTIVVSKLMAPGVLLKGIEDTLAIAHYQNKKCPNYLTDI